MSNLRPTLYLKSVAELNPDLLDRLIPENLGVMFDLDRTLVGHHDKRMSAKHIAMLGLLSESGKTLGVISNAGKKRVDRVDEIIEDASEEIGKKIYVVTSHMYNGARKPLPVLFNKMSELTGIPSDKLCYVGDQIYKDVLGANRAGYAGSVLVAPFGTGDNLAVKLLQRPLEAATRPILGMPFLTKDF